MGKVFWSFLDLHPSYSGWTSAGRAVSVAQGRDAPEELVNTVDPSRAGGPRERLYRRGNTSVNQRNYPCLRTDPIRKQ